MKSRFSIDVLFISVKGKVWLALLTVILAVSLSGIIIHNVFSETRQAVVKLTTPNKRLALIDSLYYSVHQLNQFQYNQVASSTEQSIVELAKVFNHIQSQLDTLAIYTQHTPSSQNIDSLKRLVYDHRVIYIKYLQLKVEVIRNNRFKRNVNILTKLLLENAKKNDTSIITSSTKTTTIVGSVATENKGSKTQLGILFSKIFGKKKGTQEPQKTVIEENKTVVDTISLSQQDSIQTVIMNQLSEWTNEQQKRTYQFIAREKLLLESGNRLLAGIYAILSDIKQKEAQSIDTESKQAAQLLQLGLIKFNVSMIVFFILIVVLTLLILFDISRSNVYRKELQTAKESAEQAALAKQRFLANMSHEIRNPLQAIIGFTEQAKHNPADDNMEAIYQSSIHLMKVVNEVLDYSRITSGKVSVSEEPFNLYALLNEVAQSFNVAARGKQFEFRVKHNVQPHSAFIGDGFRLKQVLYNLLGNAFKFTEQGTVIFSVMVSEPEEDTCKIECMVSDTGIGMNEQQLEFVFNEFEQATQNISNNYGGTGLGLTITRELVQAMRGDLQVNSAPDKGSVFKVVLHLKQADSVKQEQAVNTFEAYTFTQKIWLADDDAFIRRVCEGIFKKHKIKHRLFSSGEEMLAAHTEKQLPLFMIDIRMKDMNGFTLCKHIKQSHDNALVVAVTAQALPEEQQYILANGFDAILTKPFTENDLLQKIREFDKRRFDLSLLRQFSMEEESVVSENIRLLISDTRLDYSMLKKYVEQGDKNACYEIVHKLAGRLGLLGAEKLSKTCRTVEVGLQKADSIDSFVEPLKNIIREINILLFQLNNEL